MKITYYKLTEIFVKYYHCREYLLRFGEPKIEICYINKCSLNRLTLGNLVNTGNFIS